MLDLRVLDKLRAILLSDKSDSYRTVHKSDLPAATQKI